MGVNNTNYIIVASMVLGIIVFIACYTESIPEPHASLWLYLTPVMVLTNCICLSQLIDRNKIIDSDTWI